MIQETGWLNFSTFADAAGSLTGLTDSWLNEANAAASDDVRANTQTMNGPGTLRSFHLLATGLVGLSLPGNAEIVGIEARVERHAVSNTPTPTRRDLSIRLFLNGSEIGNNKSAALDWSDSVDRIDSFGSPSDTWGAQLTRDMVVSPNFGWGVAAEVITAFNVDTILRIDHMQMKVYYDTSRMFAVL